MAYPYTPFDPVTNATAANTGGTGGEHAALHDTTGDALNDLLDVLGDTPEGSEASVTARFEEIDDTLAGIQSEMAWLPGDQGFLTWTYDPAHGNANGQSITAGTVFLCAVACPPGTITSIATSVNTIGASLTAVYAGIYSSAGVLLRQTADVKASFLSLGAVILALTSPLVVASRQELRIAFLSVGGTSPLLGRDANSSTLVNINRTTANARYATADTGRTTLPATHTTMVLSSAAIWAGLV